MTSIRILVPATAALAALAALAGAALAQPATAPASPLVGKDVYAANCAACHQEDGKGIPGAFPALAGDAFVTGDPNNPVAVVLNGRGGMPTFKDELDAAHIAAAVSYVRSAWGNTAAAVSATDVAAKRNGQTMQAKSNVLGAH